MRKLRFICMLFISLNMFAQQTSMTVDNQTPGWLSSKINYSDQVTLENLKLTGYINGTDVKFIRELNLNRSLHGVIDLEDVTFVAGGEGDYVAAHDNEIDYASFSGLNKIQKLIYPRTVTEVLNVTGTTEIDTIVWTNNNVDKVILWCIGSEKTKFVFLPEGIKHVSGGANFTGKSHYIFLPSTTERVSALGNGNVIYSQITDPQHVNGRDSVYDGGDYYQSGRYLYYVSTNGSTFYVPKGTREKYLKSDFATYQERLPGDYFYSNTNKFIEYYDIESTTFKESNIVLYVGDTFQTGIEVLPDTQLSSRIEYISDNQDIITVSSSGMITAKAPGKAIVSATPILFIDGLETKTGMCEVNVCEHVTSVQLPATLKLKIGKEINVDGHTLPLGTTDDKLTYTSSDEDIATVDKNGNVKGLKQGKCTITATSVDGGYTASCEVTVMQPVAEVWLDKHELNMNVGDNSTLRVNVSPSTADDKTIAWSTEDEDVANVDADGKVTAVAAGTTKIWATSNDNNEAKDYCEVTVNQPVTGLTLDYTEYTLNDIGSTFTLTAEVQPETATNKEVTWRSSDEKVCIVSNGLVVATGYGKAIVMATTKDGGYLAMCTVEVVNATGINDYSSDTLYTIYNENGIKQSSLSKGVNIIRFGNGTTHKVFVK